MEPERKRSIAIQLAVMGAAVGAAALFRGTDVQRNRYTSREACVADYSEVQCNPDVPVGGIATGAALAVATYYYGPWYRSDYRTRNDTADPGPGRYYRSTGGTSGSIAGGGVGPASVESGTRGGFGRSGRVSARGG